MNEQNNLPNTQLVFLNIAPLNKSWSGPKGIALENKSGNDYILLLLGLHIIKFYREQLGHEVQLVAHLTQEPEVSGSIPSLATYFRFPFC